MTTYYEYNGLRLMTLQSVSDASGDQVTASQSRYDAYKNRTASVDGMGNPTYYFYDVVDRFRRSATRCSTTRISGTTRSAT